MSVRLKGKRFLVPALVIFMVIMVAGAMPTIGKTSSSRALDEYNVLARDRSAKDKIIYIINSSGGKVTAGENEAGLNIRAKLSRQTFDMLNDSPLVSKVEQYKEPSFFNDRASGVIGARPLQTQGFVMPGGLTGAGQIVAVADSGLDIGVNNEKIHPDFRTQQGKPPKIVALKSTVGNLLPSDPVGHGTHVAGTILGTGAASGGKYRGVAPEARLYFESILNERDKPSPPANLSELFEPAYLAGARIHVNSWGSSENSYTITSSQIDSFVRSYPDFLVVFGAGNAGTGPNGKGTLAAEANSKNALVVGAAENPRPGFGFDSDQYSDIASFSSRGPTADGRIKPDLVAPGSAIISARSSLVPTNFELNRLYTRMDGTSSAAAMAAGAAALLREYFISATSVKTPSAALVKAALINGAKKLGHDRMQEGFGLVDIQGTILALKNNNMVYEDDKKGIQLGKSKEYIYRVDDPNRPLKITLSWSDPAAAPGKGGSTLVNDLDLVVTDPNGRLFYGNDSGGAAIPDSLNNTEQVYIDNPVPGSYLIKVQGSGVKVDAVTDVQGNSQDFAIVYGQPPSHGILSSVAKDGKFILTDNTVLAPVPGANVNVSKDMPGQDNKQLTDEILTGADVYYVTSSGKITDLYISYSGVLASSVKGYESNGRERIMELRPDYSEGGYNLARSSSVRFTVNDSPAELIGEILPGSDVIGAVNPGTGELWQIDADYRLVTGTCTEADPLTRLVTLDYNNLYQVSKKAIINIDHKWVDIDQVDMPFAISLSDCPACLRPGSEVIMVMSPWTREVGSLHTENHLVAGKVREFRYGKITMENGKQYKIAKNAAIFKNNEISRVDTIRSGDWLEGMLSTGSDDELRRAELFSRAEYAKVAEVNKKAKELTIETDSGLSQRNLNDVKIIYRNGMSVPVGEIKAGDFVRILYDRNGSIMRLDSVPTHNDEIIIKELERSNGWLNIITVNGEIFTLLPGARLIMDGVTASSDSLSQGDMINCTYVISKPTNRRMVIDAFSGNPGGAGSSDKDDAVSRGQPRLLNTDFTGMWAEEDIRNTVQRGFLQTYADGNFQPDAAISGMDFSAALRKASGQGYDDPGNIRNKETYLSRAEGVDLLWQNALKMGADKRSGQGYTPALRDWSSVPGWARESLAASYHEGLVVGTPKGDFEPGQKLTRAEAAAMISRLIEKYML